MIQAVIVIELTSGNKVNYVRDVLATKTGNDGAAIPTDKFAGVPTKYYAYTGDGNDTYSDQSGLAGLVLADLGSLETSLLDVSTKFLDFPESAGDTDELIRYNTDQKNGRKTTITSKILKDKIERIYVEEVWTSGNKETDSRDTLPKWSPRYMADGWNEDRNGPFSFPEPTAKTLNMPKILTHTSTGSAITITWASNPNYSSYNMYLNDKFVASGISVLTYTFSGLKAGVKYTVGVCGVSGDKIGPVSYTDQTTVMAAPVIVHTENAYSIDLSWTAIPGAVLYRIYKDGILIKNDLTDITYTVSGLIPDTEYTIKVDAIGEFSDNKSTASFTATTDMLAPSIVSVVDSLANAITIAWTNLKTGYRYNIYQDEVLVATTAANVTSYIYEDLSSEVSYDLSITALNIEDEESPMSNVITESISILAPIITSTTASTADSITIDWTNLKTGYTYIIYQDGVTVTNTAANATTYTYSGLDSETEYELSISAVNSESEEGPMSNVITKSTQMIVPTLSVADLAATSLTLNWTETIPGYKYNVYQDGVAIGEELEVLTLAVTDLTAATEYTFSVGAVNTLGVESALDSETVTTLES